MKYIIEGENSPREVQETFMENDAGRPCYCSEKLITHEEDGVYNGTAFDIGTAGIYEDIYYAITQNKKLTIPSETVARIISIIEEVHARNPLERRY